MYYFRDKLLFMFDLSSITKNLDSDMIENIAQKVGISKEQASQVSMQLTHFSTERQKRKHVVVKKK